jgi:regulator of sigma E protease
MVVVSAGVIANVILAVVLFVIAFMIGVRFEAPVVGDVVATLPAATAVPDNAGQLSIQTEGLQPGDEIVNIDGRAANTFADVQIASAMSKPGVPLRLTVKRPGVDVPLEFTIVPKRDEVSGLLSIGILPGASTILESNDQGGLLTQILEQAGLGQAGVRPGMRMIAVDGVPVRTYSEFNRQVISSEGKPLQTQWQAIDSTGESTGPVIDATLTPSPELELLVWRSASGAPTFDTGILGLAPLMQIASVVKNSPNVGLLQVGDVFVKVGSIDFPRRAQLLETVAAHAGRLLPVIVLRRDERISLDVAVTRAGRMEVGIEPADQLAIAAQPLNEVLDRGADKNKNYSIRRATAIAPLNLLPGTRIVSVDSRPVDSWAELRKELLSATQAALKDNQDAAVQLGVAYPTPGQPRETLALALSADDVRRLHELTWSTELFSGLFQPIEVIRSADGNPLKAVAMGFDETRKLVMLTYLTIDRLFRRSVGIEQLHGPVGIVHLGSKIADKGLTYLIFFLAMISVNLAVINFLPLPIVDGGLFLFLIYEKLKGKPPSIAFQNAATIVGLCLIGTIFLVTFYNDIARIVG